MHLTVQTFNSCTSWPDTYQYLVAQTPMNNILKNKLSTSMTRVAGELKLRVREVRNLWSCSCPENWIAIGRAVVYYARTAHAFSAGIK